MIVLKTAARILIICYIVLFSYFMTYRKITGQDLAGRNTNPSVRQDKLPEVTARESVKPVTTAGRISGGGTPAPVPEPTALPQAAPTADDRCIIIIDSVKYDVTRFRNIHSGGDIFQCQTDMTDIFYSRHNGLYLPEMEKYRL